MNATSHTASGPVALITEAQREIDALTERINTLVRAARVRVIRGTWTGQEFVILRVNYSENARHLLNLAFPERPNEWAASCALEDVEFIA